MKKIFTKLTAVCLAAIFVCAALSQSAYAAEVPTQPTPKVTVTKTKITAEAVFNTDGYGSLTVYDSEPPLFSLIDSTGKAVFPYKTFPVQFSISDGLFVNGVKDTKRYSLFDLSGKQVIEESYDYLNYKNGYGIAVDANGQYLIDKTGKKILTLPKIFSKVILSTEDLYGFEWHSPSSYNYAWIDDYSEGLLPFYYVFSVEKNIMELNSVDPSSVPEVNGFLEYPSRYGFINLDGSIAIGQSFNEASSFKNGLALAVKNFNGNEYGWYYGFIDKSGNTVIDFIYYNALDFSEGYAAVQNKDWNWGYIDKEGNEVIPFLYKNAFGYGDGLFTAAITVGTEINEYGAEENILKYGMVDINGSTVVPFEYDDISTFINGVAYGIKNEVVYVLTLQK